MRYLCIIFLTVASASMPCLANAKLLLRKDGVTLAVTPLADRVVFCITASGDQKVSSEYGVEFKTAPHDAKLWLEALPKVVTGAPYYFDLPLRIELKTRSNAHRRIQLTLGTCSVVANACLPVAFEVEIPVIILDESTTDCSTQD